jgi:hypothetical protein
MPITSCPTCNGVVSTEAVTCPHCGDPRKPSTPSAVASQSVPSEARMRLVGVAFSVLCLPFTLLITIGAVNYLDVFPNIERAAIPILLYVIISLVLWGLALFFGFVQFGLFFVIVKGRPVTFFGR